MYPGPAHRGFARDIGPNHTPNGTTLTHTVASSSAARADPVKALRRALLGARVLLDHLSQRFIEQTMPARCRSRLQAIPTEISPDRENLSVDPLTIHEPPACVQVQQMRVERA